MKVEKKDRGWKVIDDKGRAIYFGEYGVLGANEGVIYKDYDAFYKGKGNEICYIEEYGFKNDKQNACELFDFKAKERVASEIVENPYYAKRGWTRNKLIKLCKGDKELATDIFESCEWTSPETLLNEREE